MSAIGGDSATPTVSIVGQRRHGRRKMLGHRPACQEIHLERAHHAFAIARLDAHGRFADRRAASMRCRYSTPRRAAIALEPLAHRRVGAGSRKEPAHERPIVEAGAADDDRPVAARIDVLDGRHRIAHVSRRRVLIGRLDDVDHVMRDAASLGIGTLSVPISKPR